MPRTVPDPRVHVFFAGVPADLVIIEAMLATMPVCAYGQVVIESDEPVDGADLPRRVQLRRVAVSRDEWGSALPGQALATAADAWLDEWMPDEPSATPRHFYAWIGCDGSADAAEVSRRVEHILRAGHVGD